MAGFDISRVMMLKWPSDDALSGERSMIHISRQSINWAKHSQARAEAQIKAWATEHIGLTGWTIDFSRKTGHHAVLRFNDDADAVMFRLTHDDIPTINEDHT